MKHPIATAWDEWLKSDEGKSCADGTTRGNFLENRLWRAFMAGARAQELIYIEPLKPIRETEGGK